MVKINIERIKKEKSVSELLEFGIINIDKPSNATSYDVSEFVKKKLDSLKNSNEFLAPRNQKEKDKVSLVRKTSHFGTLDPKVTGVLPIALNRACKLTGHFLGHDKEYIGIMRIHEKIPMKKIQEIINKKFLGKIKQLPPVKSKVKRAIREREIKKFKLLEQDEKNILFHTEVQAGTYIRKLIHDLGKEINGAHMLELRRIRAGIFSEDDKKYPSINLYDFEKAVSEYKEGDSKKLKQIITPAEIISDIYPVVKIKKKHADKLLHGSPILKKYSNRKEKFSKGKIICAFHKNRFLGIYEVVNKKEILAKPKFVMQPLD